MFQLCVLSVCSSTYVKCCGQRTCMRTGFGAFSLAICMASFCLASFLAAAIVLLSCFCGT